MGRVTSMRSVKVERLIFYSVLFPQSTTVAGVRGPLFTRTGALDALRSQKSIRKASLSSFPSEFPQNDGGQGHCNDQSDCARHQKTRHSHDPNPPTKPRDFKGSFKSSRQYHHGSISRSAPSARIAVHGPEIALSRSLSVSFMLGDTCFLPGE